MPGEKRARRALRDSFAREILGEPRVLERPGLRAWMERAFAAGQIGSRDAEVLDEALRVVEQFRTAGATLRYHGDFDLVGVAIFRLLERIVGVQRWCYDADAYKRALALCSGRDLPRIGAAEACSGDLERALRAGGREISEELLLDELIDSLSRRVPGGGLIGHADGGVR